MRKTKIEALKTRQHLLNAALEVFNRVGVTRSSLQAIAQEAGVTRGALYWHFDNKEKLFESLFEQKFKDFLALLNDDALHAAPDVWAHLRHSLTQLFTLLENDTQHQKLCIVMTLKCEQTETNQTITALAKRYHNLSRQQIEHALKLSVKQGKLPSNTDVSMAALYLESNLAGLINLWAENPDRFPLADTATRIISASMQTLENGAFVTK